MIPAKNAIILFVFLCVAGLGVNPQMAKTLAIGVGWSYVTEDMVVILFVVTVSGSKVLKLWSHVKYCSGQYDRLTASTWGWRGGVGVCSRTLSHPTDDFLTL